MTIMSDHMSLKLERPEKYFSIEFVVYFRKFVNKLQDQDPDMWPNRADGTGRA